jgi:hypothetical protein
MENGEWRMENGEWRMENGEWRMENGEWRMKNGVGLHLLVVEPNPDPPKSPLERGTLILDFDFGL